MRKLNFGHNDVKAENVLIMAPLNQLDTFPRTQELFKLTDFGFTKALVGGGNPDLTFFKRKLLPQWYESFQGSGCLSFFCKSSGVPSEFAARLNTYTDFDQVLADPYLKGFK